MALPISLNEPAPKLTAAQIETRMKSLQLAYIHREGHGKQLKDAAVHENLVATVGSNVLNLYDNDNDGHLDLFFHFDNIAIPDSGVEGGDLSCVAFLEAPTVPEDVQIAFGGVSGELQVISVSEQAVVRHFRAHMGDGGIVSIASHPTLPLVVSVGGGKDRWVRVWDLAKPDAEARCSWMVGAGVGAGGVPVIARFDSTGSIFVALSNGCVQRFRLDQPTPAPEFSFTAGPKGIMSMAVLRQGQGQGQGRVLTKGKDGKITVWNANGTPAVSWAVNRSEGRIGVSKCGGYVCVGQQGGGGSIFKLELGSTATATAKVSPIAAFQQGRIRVEIRRCFFSSDLRNVLCIGGQGTLWRFDPVEEAEAEAEAEMVD